MTRDLPFYDIFAPTKNSSFEVSNDVIACDLWFGPFLIKNPGYTYAPPHYKILATRLDVVPVV